MRYLLALLLAVVGFYAWTMHAATLPNSTDPGRVIAR